MRLDIANERIRRLARCGDSAADSGSALPTKTASRARRALLLALAGLFRAHLRHRQRQGPQRPVSEHQIDALRVVRLFHLEPRDPHLFGHVRRHPSFAVGTVEIAMFSRAAISRRSGSIVVTAQLLEYPKNLVCVDCFMMSIILRANRD